MPIKCTKRKVLGPSPCERDAAEESYSVYYGLKRPKFSKYYKNMYLDVITKRAVLKACASVSYSGEEEIFEGSGTIIESDNVTSVILTSAILVRCPLGGTAIPDNIKVVVYPLDGRSFQGQILACDFHYNIAAIKIQSEGPLPTACLRQLNDSITIYPSQLHIPEEKPFQLRPHSNSNNLMPGDRVSAFGHYFVKPYDIMGPPGEFRDPRQPYLGMDMTNLYAADLHVMEKIIHMFPNVFKGVIVEGVIPGSSADFAGIIPNDVIVKFGGKTIQGVLELAAVGI